MLRGGENKFGMKVHSLRMAHCYLSKVLEYIDIYSWFLSTSLERDGCCVSNMWFVLLSSRSQSVQNGADSQWHSLLSSWFLKVSFFRKLHNISTIIKFCVRDMQFYGKVRRIKEESKAPPWELESKTPSYFKVYINMLKDWGLGCTDPVFSVVIVGSVGQVSLA